VRRRTFSLLALVAVAAVPRPAQDPFPQLVVRELSVFDPGMSAEAWLRAHPSDSVVSFVDSLTRDTQTWCLRATASFTLPDGRPAKRIAYFFPPSPPADLALPTATGRALQQQGCRLGGIWIEAPATATDTALAGQVRSALAQKLGAEAPQPDSLFGRPITQRLRESQTARGNDLRLFDAGLSGSSWWRVVGVWRRDSITTITTYDVGLPPSGGHRLLALTMAGRAHFGAGLADTQDIVTVRRDSARVAALLLTAGVDAPLASGARSLWGQALAWYGGRGGAPTPPPASAVLPVLRGLVSAARTLGRTQRAAALLAADMTLGARGIENSMAGDSDGAARRVLTGLGATFVHSELEASYNYTHSWLTAARAADPNGEAARLAIILQLERGFNENGICGGGGDAFRRVATVGESLLTHLPDSLAAEVHLLVAQSYGDIVELAFNSDMAEYFDREKYAAEAGSARARAIAHYRHGLARDHSSPIARASWLEAWRLLAGLPPGTTHFACVYD